MTLQHWHMSADKPQPGSKPFEVNYIVRDGYQEAELKILRADGYAVSMAACWEASHLGPEPIGKLQQT